MTNFLIYPAIDGNYSFPSEVNQAIANSSELSATIATATVGKLDKTEAATTLAPAAAARPGNRVVFLGDSITKGADERDIVYRQQSWPVYATVTSEQRIHYVRNAGFPGETSTQILARFDAEVTPYAPNLVTIAVGTNDLSGTAQLPTARANITELVRKVRAIGAVPVLCTLAPGESASPATRRKETIQLNAWIRDFASKQGLTIIDFYGLLTDPANGNYLADYSSGDAVHPNAAGYAAMGKYAAGVLAPLLPDWRPLLPQDNADPNNLLGNALFLTDGDANNIPDGWSNQAGVTGQTIALVAGTAPVKGNWFKYTLAASSGISILFRTISGASIVPGNQYLFTGRVKSSGLSSGAAAKAFIRWTATANRDDAPLQSLVYDIDSGVFHCIVTPPAGATAVQVQLTSPAGTGTIQYAQIGLYNLTAMGVL